MELSRVSLVKAPAPYHYPLNERLTEHDRTYLGRIDFANLYELKNKPYPLTSYAPYYSEPHNS